MVCDDGPFPNGRLKVHMLGCDAASDTRRLFVSLSTALAHAKAVGVRRVLTYAQCTRDHGELRLVEEHVVDGLESRRRPLGCSGSDLAMLNALDGRLRFAFKFDEHMDVCGIQDSGDAALRDHLERGDLPAWFKDNLSTFAVFRRDVES